MKLYHSPTSPFARKVMVVLIETGQDGAVSLQPATGNPLDPGTMPLALNPLGQIPCLERPDGPALYDSRVICRYLDDRAGGRLYPPAPRLWEALTLESLADGMLNAAVLMRYETHVRPAATQNHDWIEGQWQKIARSLDVLEDRWMAYLSGPVDIGQIALGAALGYLDFRHGARDWRTGRPGLAAWDAAFAARPSMAATRPQG